jgi:hypothetical protein
MILAEVPREQLHVVPARAVDTRARLAAAGCDCEHCEDGGEPADHRFLRSFDNTSSAQFSDARALA